MNQSVSAHKTTINNNMPVASSFSLQVPTTMPSLSQQHQSNTTMATNITTTIAGAPGFVDSQAPTTTYYQHQHLQGGRPVFTQVGVQHPYHMTHQMTLAHSNMPSQQHPPNVQVHHHPYHPPQQQQQQQQQARMMVIPSSSGAATQQQQRGGFATITTAFPNWVTSQHARSMPIPSSGPPPLPALAEPTTRPPQHVIMHRPPPMMAPPPQAANAAYQQPHSNNNNLPRGFQQQGPAPAVSGNNVNINGRIMTWVHAQNGAPPSHMVATSTLQHQRRPPVPAVVGMAHSQQQPAPVSPPHPKSGAPVSSSSSSSYPWQIVTGPKVPPAPVGSYHHRHHAPTPTWAQQPPGTTNQTAFGPFSQANRAKAVSPPVQAGPPVGPSSSANPTAPSSSAVSSSSNAGPHHHHHHPGTLSSSSSSNTMLVLPDGRLVPLPQGSVVVYTPTTTNNHHQAPSYSQQDLSWPQATASAPQHTPHPSMMMAKNHHHQTQTTLPNNNNKTQTTPAVVVEETTTTTTTTTTSRHQEEEASRQHPQHLEPPSQSAVDEAAENLLILREKGDKKSLPMIKPNHKTTTTTKEVVAHKKTLTSLPKRKRPYKRNHVSFPQRLHQMLATLEDEGLQDICCFSDDGTMVQVLKPTALEQKVLPRFFRAKQWTSFQRLLRLYGFVRVGGDRVGGTYAMYQHPLFRKGCEELSVSMNYKNGS